MIIRRVKLLRYAGIVSSDYMNYNVYIEQMIRSKHKNEETCLSWQMLSIKNIKTQAWSDDIHDWIFVHKK